MTRSMDVRGIHRRSVCDLVAGGLTEGGCVDKHLVINCDFAPTLIDLAGLIQAHVNSELPECQP
jgi:hypothetical protein